MATNYTIEDVEYLRGKANLSYEEAVEMLEKFNGDLTRAIIELERHGRVKNPANIKESSNTQANTGRGFWESVSAAFNACMRSSVEIKRKDITHVNLPAMIIIIISLMAPWVFLFGLILMLLTGCRVKVITRSSSATPDIRNYVNNVADNVKESVSNFSFETQKEDRVSADNDDDEYNETTVE